jgi:hypothetical protein
VDFQAALQSLSAFLSAQEGICLLAPPAFAGEASRLSGQGAELRKIVLAAEIRHELQWRAALEGLHESPAGWAIPRECAFAWAPEGEAGNAPGCGKLHVRCQIDWILPMAGALDAMADPAPGAPA